MNFSCWAELGWAGQLGREIVAFVFRNLTSVGTKGGRGVEVINWWEHKREKIRSSRKQEDVRSPTGQCDNELCRAKTRRKREKIIKLILCSVSVQKQPFLSNAEDHWN